MSNFFSLRHSLIDNGISPSDFITEFFLKDPTASLSVKGGKFIN